MNVQVKQEVAEVICIKEEPEEEEAVMATLLLDCKLEQNHRAETEVSQSLNLITDAHHDRTFVVKLASPLHGCLAASRKA